MKDFDRQTSAVELSLRLPHLRGTPRTSPTPPTPSILWLCAGNAFVARDGATALLLSAAQEPAIRLGIAAGLVAGDSLRGARVLKWPDVEPRPPISTAAEVSE